MDRGTAIALDTRGLCSETVEGFKQVSDRPLVHTGIASEGTGEPCQGKHGGEKAHGCPGISEIKRLLWIGKMSLLSMHIQGGTLLIYRHTKSGQRLPGNVCIIT
jgi:hypothetical protein